MIDARNATPVVGRVLVGCVLEDAGDGQDRLGRQKIAAEWDDGLGRAFLVGVERSGGAHAFDDGGSLGLQVAADTVLIAVVAAGTDVGGFVLASTGAEGLVAAPALVAHWVDPLGKG
jgi:hypothetical protein